MNCLFTDTAPKSGAFFHVVPVLKSPAAVALLGTFMCASAMCAESQNDFHILASTGQTIAGKTLISFRSADINDAGTVAFSATFAGGSGIFRGSELLVQPGSTIDGKVIIAVRDAFGEGSKVAINNDGTIAFHSFFGGGEGVFTLEKLLYMPTGTGVGPGGAASHLNNLVMNEAGLVAFQASYPGGSAVYTIAGEIFFGHRSVSGNRLCNIYQAGPPALGAQTVAFWGFCLGQPLGPQPSYGGGAIFNVPLLGGSARGTPGIAEGDIIAGKTLTVMSCPALNERGELVFFGGFAGGSGLFTPSRLLVATGGVIDGKTLTSVNCPALNNRGTLAFAGSFAGGSGIFAGSRLMVATGDLIEGKTLTGFLSTPAINKTGTVAFLASFSDGTQGIVVGEQSQQGDVTEDEHGKVRKSSGI
jgi:hypothetical protein